MELDNEITLPVGIVSPTDIARLTREIESVDNFFRDAEIRQSGESNKLPRLSKLMDQLITDNQLNLLQNDDRVKISKVLETLHESAPVMHISFSVDPPGPYVQKVVAWLRNNIHPQVLVTVGLQPNIGAGCIVRTTNKMFDFSLREFFAQKREYFVEKLHDSISDTGTTAAEEISQGDPQINEEVKPATTAPAAQEALTKPAAPVTDQPMEATTG